MVDVELPDKSQILCDIPNRLAKKVWIKRGDYVIVELLPLNPKHTDSKPRATVAHILLPDSIKQLQRDNLWPAEFELKTTQNKTLPTSDEPLGTGGGLNLPPSFDSDSEEEEDADQDQDEEDMDLPPNPNRRLPPGFSSDDE